MAEVACCGFRAATKVVKVLWLARDFEMAAATEIAINVFFADQFFHEINRFERSGVHAGSGFFAVA